MTTLITLLCLTWAGLILAAGWAHFHRNHNIK